MLAPAYMAKIAIMQYKNSREEEREGKKRNVFNRKNQGKRAGRSAISIYSQEVGKFRLMKAVAALSKGGRIRQRR